MTVWRVLMLLAALLPVQVHAVEPLALLIADSISFDQATQKLVAAGNVQIIYDGNSLTAVSISYDAASDTITAEGPLVLTDSTGSTIFADMASLSADLQTGLIGGARLLLEEKFQIAAIEARRNSGRYTTLYKAVGSSCTVCFDRPVPMWQIRAKRIIHDSEEKRIYFEDARLDVFGLTVFGLPRLRIPDPSVARASGFLVPEFSSSDIYGYGLKLPYYHVIDGRSDVTLTPFLISNGSALLEAEYRLWLPGGEMLWEGSILPVDGMGTGPWRGFLAAEGSMALGSGFEGVFDIMATSDNAFLKQFDYSDEDRLTSSVGVVRYREDDYLEFGTVVFQNLRDDADNATIPLVLPEFFFRRHLPSDLIGGQLAVTANSYGLTRDSGRDVYRLGFGMDWRRNWTFSSGLLAGTFAQAEGNLYRVYDDPLYQTGETLTVLAPTAGVELRWPLSRQDGAALQVIEPIAQLVYTGSPGFNDEVPNEDSQQVEFDETNLFSISRYPGLDRFETGFRANLGVTYNRYSPDGWNLGLTAGRVFRADVESGFNDGSGLELQESDYVGALSLELPPNIRNINRVLFDTSFDFKRAESRLWMDYENYGLEAGFLHLSAEPNAAAPFPRNEVDGAGRYRFLPNWELVADFRYNITQDTPINAGAGLTFANECVRVDLSVSRSYTTSDNVPPGTSYGLTINLAGFGGSSEEIWPARQCRLEWN